MNAKQRDLWGNSHPATGHPIRDQLAAIMENEPETQADEDLLAARWLERTLAVADTMDLYTEQLARIIRTYRKADIRRRRQELVYMGYPWPEEEAERRQKRARLGPP